MLSVASLSLPIPCALHNRDEMGEMCYSSAASVVSYWKTPNVSNSDCYLFRHLQTGLKSSGCFSGQVYYLQFIVKGNGVFIMTRNKMKAH